MIKTNSKLVNHAAGNLFWSFEFRSFEIVSNFDIRYSDLLPTRLFNFRRKNKTAFYATICQGML